MVNTWIELEQERKTIRSGGKLNWRDIDESLDLGLSPRAYADTDFGIIALNSIRKVINAEKKFDVMSKDIIERQATKQGYDNTNYKDVRPAW